MGDAWLIVVDDPDAYIHNLREHNLMAHSWSKTVLCVYLP